MHPARSAALVAVASLLSVACSESGDERFARRLSRLGVRPWVSESEIPAEPQTAPAMVIWEVTGHAEDSAPTPEQSSAAQQLVERSLASAVEHGWSDFAKARADGYGQMFSDPTHYVKVDHVLDDAILDPERPEFLMYYDTEEGKALVGYMFLVRSPEEWGPQIGGALTIWHYHVWNRMGCLLGGLLVIADADAEGHCRRGVPSHRSPEMLHVWLLDHPEGPFATPMGINRRLLPELLARRRAARGF